MPYPPPRKIVKAAERGLGNINKYITSEECEPLFELLSKYSKVDRDHLFLGPGSDIIIREVINAFSRGRNLITEYPSIPPRSRYMHGYRVKLIKIRLNPPDFNLDPELLVDIADKSLVVIGNPNNPTGKDIISRRALKLILENTDALVIIDEAYYEFSGVTYADLVEKYPNLIIVRTLDKAFGLAGLRIGYAIGGETFRHALQSLHFTLSRPSIYAAIEAIENLNYMKKNVGIILKERERMRKALEELGIKTYLSKTNFFLIKTEIYDLVDRLRKRGVIVLDLSSIWIRGFIRISVGTPEENNFFLAAIKNVLEEHD